MKCTALTILEVVSFQQCNETWMQDQHNFTSFTLEFGRWTFPFGCAHTTPQTQSCNCLMFELSFFKSHHLTVSWVWSLSWGGLRMGLSWSHYQQIMNQNQTKFSVVNLPTSGWQN